jgi:hypothetical protein
MGNLHLVTVNVVNAVPKNPKFSGSVVPAKVGGTRNIAKKTIALLLREIAMQKAVQQM